MNVFTDVLQKQMMIVVNSTIIQGCRDIVELSTFLLVYCKIPSVIYKAKYFPFSVNTCECIF